MARADRFTLTQKKRKIYSDFSNNFDKNQFTGYLGEVTNEEAVRQSLRNIILTGQGERFFDSSKGGNLREYLFDQFDSGKLQKIKFDLQQTLRTYEPRAELVDIAIPDTQDFTEGTLRSNLTIGNTELDANLLTIRITYMVKNLPDVQTLEVDVRRIR